MKNKNLLLLALPALLALGITAGCSDTLGLTHITYYPTIEVLGTNPAVVYVGGTFTDEGCYVDLNGEDVTASAKVSSNVNTSEMGIYSVTYSAVNDDGFSASASRTVYVVKENSIDNIYLGESQTPTRHYTNAPIFITDNGDGTYLLDDLMGGLQFYGMNPGFEPTLDFHAEINIKIEDDNSVVAVGDVGSWYFGDSGTITLTLSSGTYDPATGSFVLNVMYDTATSSTALTVTLHSIKQ
ncbi:MAG: DUF5011 domain-containing protein [Mediterranea sp.]|jgi:hypothetical protein|nr:DUF5011 domain-containing protein [Mediterranea sp.]